MKRYITYILLITMLLSTQTFSLKIDDLADISGESAADMLYNLGLFQGAPQGYELDRNMTRAEAGVMLVRLLGREQEALSIDCTHPFTDVPDWASPYVGWLYANEMTNGTGNDRYSPDLPTTHEQYALFLSRASAGHLTGEIDSKLYPRAAWNHEVDGTSDPQAYLRGIILTRRDAVKLSVIGLTQKYMSNATLAQKLIAQEIFTKEALLEEAAKLVGADMAMTEFLPEYPVWYQGVETEYTISGVQLLARQKDGKDRLIANDIQAARLLHRDTLGSLLLAQRSDGVHCYFDDIHSQVVTDIGISMLPDDLYTVKILNADDDLYLACQSGVYLFNMYKKDIVRLTDIPHEENAPLGFCSGSEGVVVIAEGGEVIFANKQGQPNTIALPILPQLLADYGYLKDYDGTKLTFGIKVGESYSTGGFISLIYCMIEADENGLTITGQMRYDFQVSDPQAGTWSLVYTHEDTLKDYQEKLANEWRS